MLEYEPLKKWTEAYEKKYPDVSKFMAHQSLQHYKEIDFDKIDDPLILKQFEWEKITERLKQAVDNPDKIFRHCMEELKQSLEEKLMQEQKLSNNKKLDQTVKKSQKKSQAIE